jgi:hypothetical protein
MQVRGLLIYIKQPFKKRLNQKFYDKYYIGFATLFSKAGFATLFELVPWQKRR